jgi:signal transduction histidine kinase
MLYHQRYDLNRKKEGNIEERFLSHVSHRVRTPLNSVIGFSKLLMNTDPDEQRTREFAEKIMDSGYQILQYFQNLIDLSELESGMIKVNPVEAELNHLLSGIVGGYKDRLGSDHSIDIYLMSNEKELMMFTDEYILERIINNVIELSRSHIDQGLVTIEYELKDNGYVSMEIRGIRSSDLNGHNKDKQAENHEYDFFTWKAIQQLTEMLQGEVTSSSDACEVIYTINFPRKI